MKATIRNGNDSYHFSSLVTEQAQRIFGPVVSAAYLDLVLGSEAEYICENGIQLNQQSRRQGEIILAFGDRLVSFSVSEWGNINPFISEE